MTDIAVNAKAAFSDSGCLSPKLLNNIKSCEVIMSRTHFYGTKALSDVLWSVLGLIIVCSLAVLGVLALGLLIVLLVRSLWLIV
jgi:hypothetical protein